MKRSRRIQPSNHHRLVEFINFDDFTSLFLVFLRNIFRFPRRRPLIISFLLFTVGVEDRFSAVVRRERILHEYLQWRIANWSKRRCFGDVGRAMLQL